MTIAAGPATPAPLEKRDLAPFRGILLVLAVAAAVRAVFGFLIADTFDYDEFVILLLGRDTAHGAVPYHTFMFFHPPGILALYAALNPLLDHWWPLGRVVAALADVATAGLVWAAARVVWDARAGLAAGLLYAVHPLALVASVRISQDPILTFLGMAGLVVLLTHRGRAAAVAAGALLGAALWIKYPAAYFLPVYVLAAPRRVLFVGAGCVLSAALLFLPDREHLAALYQQTVTFQTTRWSMPLAQRVETTALFWFVANVLALPGLSRRPPAWLVAGFGLGVLFVFTSQVYYHYFVPTIPFGAILAGPVLARRAGLIVPAGAVLALGWALLIDRGGPSPLYVTAAHLSSVMPAVEVLDRETKPSAPILADQYEYAYLAHRPALAHYFWNVGVIVSKTYLERRLGGAGAIVLSHGASSGYPRGFVAYVRSRHYRTFDLNGTIVWVLPGQ
ncbi:MAG TPA: glycosyltransferase family 39 protein [Chloroflexota bacterium]|nr:glycosyltransferase family 39 protein [Chloroflexota bacterium]